MRRQLGLGWGQAEYQGRNTAVARRILAARTGPGPAPVEYAVAVDRYLASASLGAASRRVYRISLNGWAWPLVGRRRPAGSGRRRAAPPVVPLALLDQPRIAARLAAAVADRATVAEARTVNRELSALRSAVGWWQEQGWISTDPAAGLRHLARPAAPLPALTAAQVGALLRMPASLREHAFWRLLAETAAPAEDLLALDADQLDPAGQRTRPGTGPAGTLRWSPATADRLSWLLAGRSRGPVFLTERRAPAGVARPDVCPLTGRARMSYRRAAELFTVLSRPLDPAGRGWTLHQLRDAARAG
jgi:integrase/recombinase XerD